MKSTIALLSVIALCAGCETLSQHRKATAVIGSLLITSAILSSQGSKKPPEPRMSNPLVSCQGDICK